MSKSKSSNYSYSDLTICCSLAVDYLELEVISSSRLDSDFIESMIAESATMIACTKLVLRPIALKVFWLNRCSSSVSLRALSARFVFISVLKSGSTLSLKLVSETG